MASFDIDLRQGDGEGRRINLAVVPVLFSQLSEFFYAKKQIALANFGTLFRTYPLRITFT